MIIWPFWSSHQNRQRKIFQTIWRCSKMLKIKSFFGHPSTNIHTYAHTYIHIYECTLLRQSRRYLKISLYEFFFHYGVQYRLHHVTPSVQISMTLSPPFSIVHCFRPVFRTISRIGTELLYVGSRGSSCLCSSMWRGPLEYVTYKFVPTSLAVSCMSGSSNFDLTVRSDFHMTDSL